MGLFLSRHHGVDTSSLVKHFNTCSVGCYEIQCRDVCLPGGRMTTVVITFLFPSAIIRSETQTVFTGQKKTSPAMYVLVLNMSVRHLVINRLLIMMFTLKCQIQSDAPCPCPIASTVPIDQKTITNSLM